MISFFEVETRKKGACTIYNCDGYTNKKTVLGAVHEIGKEIAKIDSGEGQLLTSAKTEADAKSCLVRNESAETYCFELEEVSCASRWDEEAEEMEYTEGTYYFHIRFFVWDEETEENEEEGEENTMKYNYFEAVKADVKEYIENEIDFTEWTENREGLEKELNETLWTEDSVTGNASGSYTFNTWKAEENLSHNWDEIERVASEFGYDPVISDGYEYGAEWWDVTIRCYYLGQAIGEVLDEYEAAGAFDEAEEAEEAPETLAGIAASIAGAIVKGTEPEANTEPVNA